MTSVDDLRHQPFTREKKNYFSLVLNIQQFIAQNTGPTTSLSVLRFRKNINGNDERQSLEYDSCNKAMQYDALQLCRANSMAVTVVFCFKN